MLPNEEIIDQFEGVSSPDFSKADEPHSALANLLLRGPEVLVRT